MDVRCGDPGSGHLTAVAAHAAISETRGFNIRKNDESVVAMLVCYPDLPDPCREEKAEPCTGSGFRRDLLGAGNLLIESWTTLSL